MIKRNIFLPILKFTQTSPVTPMQSPFAVFTEIELGVICDVNPSVASFHVHAADFST